MTEPEKLLYQRLSECRKQKKRDPLYISFLYEILFFNSFFGKFNLHSETTTLTHSDYEDKMNSIFNKIPQK